MTLVRGPPGADPSWGNVFSFSRRPSHTPHLEVLKRAELLEWDSVQPVKVFDESWKEWHGCRVLAANWNEITVDAESAELFAALRPSSRASIHLLAGLPAPDGLGWMQGSPPEAWVCALGLDEVELCLCPLLDPDWREGGRSPRTPRMSRSVYRGNCRPAPTCCLPTRADRRWPNRSSKSAPGSL